MSKNKSVCFVRRININIPVFSLSHSFLSFTLPLSGLWSQRNISFYQSVAKIDVVKALFKFLFPLTSHLQIFKNLILTTGI